MLPAGRGGAGGEGCEEEVAARLMAVVLRGKLFGYCAQTRPGAAPFGTGDAVAVALRMACASVPREALAKHSPVTAVGRGC